MRNPISPSDLSELLVSDQAHALIDVRERVEYNIAHIPRATTIPRRLLEWRAQRLVPYLPTPVVVYDDDGRRADLAAETLAAMGYSDVQTLAGGLNRWASEDLPTEWGVNVPSKDFGEQVFEQEGIQEITPDELLAWMNQGRQMVLLDTRTPEEHAASTVPGSRSVPGGELALRVPALVDSPDMPVVVHCAGRTRGIVAARALSRIGLHNVYYLKNGTMGWVLSGHELEYGSDRLSLPNPDGSTLRDTEAKVRRLADVDGVRWLSPDGLRKVMARSTSENVYLVDVRSRDEHAAGHIAGFRWFPGGQCVQAADDLVGVRQGHVVFACDGSVRAGMTSSWFRRMGFPNVYAVDGGVKAWVEGGGTLEEGLAPDMPWGIEAARAGLPTFTAAELHSAMASADPPTVVFVGMSNQFVAGHPTGASWVNRSWLEHRIGDAAPDRLGDVVVVCPDGVTSTLAAAALRPMGYERAAVLEGGMAAWRAAGLPVELGLSGVMAPPNDVLPAGTDRTWAEMIQYLTWETKLGEKYRRQAGSAGGSTA